MDVITCHGGLKLIHGGKKGAPVIQPHLSNSQWFDIIFICLGPP